MNLLYLIAFVFALSGWGIMPYLRFFRTSRDPLERFLIMQAIGFTLTWLFVFLLCAVHVLQPFWIHLWIIAGCVIYILNWRKEVYKGVWLTEISSGFSNLNIRALVILMSSLAVVSYCIFLYLTFAPTTTWDPLDYHYVMPREWLANSGFVNLPKIMYSNFPASVELIWLTGMALYGEIVSNHLTWWFGFLMGLTLLHIGKKWFSTVAGWIGLVLFLALPIVYTEEIPGGVIDLAVFTFNLLTIHFALLYAKDENREDAFLTCLFASNGLAMKHSSLLSLIFAIAIILFVFYKKGKLNAGLKSSAIISACAFILPLLWYIKSYIYTGNPVYPFMDSVFNPNSNLSIDILYWSNPNFTCNTFDWLTYWYHVITDIGMVQYRFRLINGIYLGMLPLVYWAIKKPGYHRAFIAYAFSMIVMLLYSAPGEPRYQLAAWAVLGISYGFGLFESGIMRDSTMRRLIPLAIIIPLSITLVMSVHENRHIFNYVFGQDDSRDYYLNTMGVYPLIDYMNTSTAEDSLIIWCDPRVYLFDRDYIPAYPFDTGVLPSWRNEPLDIVREWKNMGVTHLGFSIGSNYRAWVVAVILYQAELDGVESGYAYIEDQFAPGIKYEEGMKLDFSFDPMDRRVQRLGPLTPRAIQLASYATRGIDHVIKDGYWVYRADIDLLINERSDDIDVIMIRKLIDIGRMGFLSPRKSIETEGIIYEMNYEPLKWLDGQNTGGDA
ncbi:hypothetical protein J7L05_00325 [bacterium]|nr:hypothetical protein [bacterium]